MSDDPSKKPTNLVLECFDFRKKTEWGMAKRLEKASAY